MTEQEWQTATRPGPMFKHLHPTRRSCRRKFWLYGAACCRRIWPRITLGASRQAVEAAEDFADGRLSRLGLEAVSEAAHAVEGIDDDPVVTAAAHAADYVGPDGWANASSAGESVVESLADAEARRAEEQYQSDLIRDLFGPLPFRAVESDPAWVSWRGGAAKQLAETIYTEAAFDRLPVLADMLEEAGCRNSEILNHCRHAGPHVRGCWVIDLLTNRPA